MNRAEIIDRIAPHRDELAKRYKVASLSLFGSVARGESRPHGDIDLLVAFESPPGFDGYMALKWYLEELLESRVDLVMEGALRPEARSIVESEAVRVA